MGCWEFTGDLLRRTLPPPKVLSAVYVFSSPFPSLHTVIIFLSICTPSPTVSVPPSGILSLDRKVWFNIYCIVTLISHDMTSMSAPKQPMAVALRQSFSLFVCGFVCVLCVHVCIKGITLQYS